MTRRDEEYIDNRLCAPADGASEAIERLRAVGRTAEAAKVMAAVRALMDTCREVRADLRARA